MRTKGKGKKKEDDHQGGRKKKITKPHTIAKYSISFPGWYGC